MEQYSSLVKAFFEDSVDPVTLTSLEDGSYYYVNKAYCKLVGYSRKELGNLSVIDIDQNLTRENFNQIKKQAIEDDPVVLETFLITKNGKEIPVEKSVKYVKIENTEFFFVVIHDASDKYLLRSVLKGNQKELEIFKFFVESAPYSLLIVDKEENITFANKAAYAQFNFALKSGSKITSLMPNIDWGGIIRKLAVKSSIKLETNCNSKVNSGRNNEGSFIAEVILHKIKYNNQDCICLFVTDISDRKKFEYELKDSQDRFRLAAIASKDGIWEWKCGEDKEYWSPSYYKLLGYKEGEIEPSFNNFQANIHPDFREKMYEAINTHLKTKIPYELEVKIKVKSGKYRWFICRGHAEWDKDGNPIRMVGTLRSIHNRKLREQQIINYNKKLEQINRDLEDFAYIASHDLKQPLHAIHYYSTFLVEDHKDKLDAEGSMMLSRLKEQANYMDKLINNLLVYARTTKKTRFTPVNLNKIVDEVITSMDSYLKENNAEIIIEKELPVVKCNEEIISELFRNLISNGIKYNSNKEKKIIIKSSIEPKYYKFQVIDNGIGISKEFHKSIFGLFKRLHPQEEFGGGTGFGLTLVKKIVDLHQGKITVESAPGKGSIFTFSLLRSII